MVPTYIKKLRAGIITRPRSGIAFSRRWFTNRLSLYYLYIQALANSNTRHFATMDKELYFDVVSEEGAGGLYKMDDSKDNTGFYYHYTASDLDTEKVLVTETKYVDFAAFWKAFCKNPEWFCMHPLYIHPEIRGVIGEALARVKWQQVADDKWREMYQAQWNKTLHAPPTYYAPVKPRPKQ